MKECAEYAASFDDHTGLPVEEFSYSPDGSDDGKDLFGIQDGFQTILGCRPCNRSPVDGHNNLQATVTSGDFTQESIDALDVNQYVLVFPTYKLHTEDDPIQDVLNGRGLNVEAEYEALS